MPGKSYAKRTRSNNRNKTTKRGRSMRQRGGNSAELESFIQTLDQGNTKQNVIYAIALVLEFDSNPPKELKQQFARLRKEHGITGEEIMSERYNIDGSKIDDRSSDEFDNLAKDVISAFNK